MCKGGDFVKISEALSGIRVKDVQQVLFSTYTKPNRSSYKRERVLALIFVLQGEINFVCDGKNFKVKQGQGILLTGDKTYVYRREKPAEIFLVNFEPYDNLGSEEFMVFDVENIADYRPELQAMYNLTPFDMPYKMVAFLSVFYNVISKIIRTETYKHPALRGAVKYIKDNISNPDLDVAEIAENSNFSEGHLRRMFKSQFGVSPMQYIQNLRFNMAEAMLMNGELSIKEISESCGYASQFYFSRIFKKKIGASPSEYRKRQSAL